MAKSDDFVIRAAVGHIQGPRSAVFRIWSPRGKSDVYAGVRDIAGEIKISLHETGECNAGLTSQFAKEEARAVAAMGGSPRQSQWTRKMHVGYRVVTPLKFIVPASELRTWREQPGEAENVTWLGPPAQGRSIIISCAFSGQCLEDDKWPDHPNGTQLLGTKLLPNDEKFWLVCQDCPTGPVERIMFSEAQAHMRRQRMVRFSSITDDTPPAPRRLIFKEKFEDGLLIVLDASAQ